MSPPRKPSTGHEVSNEVLSEQVRGVSGRIDGIDQTLRAVAESLTAFVRLEERHAALIRQVETLVEEMTSHAVEDDKHHEIISRRVDEVEKTLPGLREMRKYFMALLVGLATLVGLGVYNGYLNSRQDMRATTPAPPYSVPSEGARVPLVVVPQPGQ